MQKKSVLWISIMVGLLGILAAALGFAAEAKHVRAGQVKMAANGTCVYPRSPALALGVTAALVLMIAQMIISLAGGCLCCARNGPYPPSSNRTIAIICLVVSWITFVIAFVLLLAGAALNDQHYEDGGYFGDYCYVVKSGVFAGGAVLAMATVTLGIIYYITASAVKRSAAWGHQNPSIAMAQPQYGQSNVQPVFVPEHIYSQYSEYPQYAHGSQQPPQQAERTLRAPWK